MQKYKSYELYEAIMEAFDSLPLAATLDMGDGHIFFCVHGGISPSFKTLQEINDLNRRIELPHSGGMW